MFEISNSSEISQPEDHEVRSTDDAAKMDAEQKGHDYVSGMEDNLGMPEAQIERELDDALRGIELTEYDQETVGYIMHSNKRDLQISGVEGGKLDAALRELKPLVLALQKLSTINIGAILGNYPEQLGQAAEKRAQKMTDKIAETHLKASDEAKSGREKTPQEALDKILTRTKLDRKYIKLNQELRQKDRENLKDIHLKKRMGRKRKALVLAEIERRLNHADLYRVLMLQLGVVKGKILSGEYPESLMGEVDRRTEAILQAMRELYGKRIER